MLSINGKVKAFDLEITRENKKGNMFMFNSVDSYTSGSSIDTILETPSYTNGLIAASINPDVITEIPDFLIQLYINPTYTVGVDITNQAQCMNCYLGKVNKLTLKNSVTLTNEGSLYYQIKIFGTELVGERYSGDKNFPTKYIIFKPSTSYLLRTKNDGTETGEVLTTYYWLQDYKL